MIDWAKVVRAIRLTGMTAMAISDRLDEMEIDVGMDYIYRLARSRRRNVRFEIGDALLRLLKERDPKTYDRLYVQTRTDRRRRAA